MTPNEQAVAHLGLKIGEQRISVSVSVPKGPATLREMLPAAQELTNAVVAAAEAAVAAEGRKISCTAGCGACCRQLVPIAPSEAHHLAALVERLPEPRRSQVRERFAAAISRLTQAGLIDALRHPERLDEAMVTPFGLEYFRQGIPCPFLEQESCSIHPERPLACREHLVTSPAAYCADPSPKKVEGVMLPIKLSRVLRQLDQASHPAAPPWLPLILSLEWAAQDSAKPLARPGPVWLRQFVERMTGKALSPFGATEGG
jgi:Fe-S-cluster containining protein